MNTEELDPEKIIDEFNRWKDRGDLKTIAKNTGVGYNMVCRVFQKKMQIKKHYKVLAEANRIVNEYKAYLAKS